MNEVFMHIFTGDLVLIREYNKMLMEIQFDMNDSYFAYASIMDNYEYLGDL